MDESPLPAIGILCVGVAVLLAVAAWPEQPTASPAAGAIPMSILLALGTGIAFSARRHGKVERRMGAAIAGAGGMGIALMGAMSIMGSEATASGDWAAAGIALVGFLCVGIAAVDHRGIAPQGVLNASGFILRGLALVFAGYLVAGLVFALLIDGPATIGFTVPFLLEVALQPIALGLGFGLATVGFVISTGRGLDYLDFSRPSREQGFWIIGGSVAIIGAWLGMSLLFRLLDIDVARHAVGRDGDLIGGVVVLIALSLTIISVIGEELLFRNGLQKHLAERFPAWSAIIGTSLVFAIGHLTAYAGIAGFDVAASLAVVFVLSVIIGVTYERTENLIVPIAIHWIYNLVAYGIIYIQVIG